MTTFKSEEASRLHLIFGNDKPSFIFSVLEDLNASSQTLTKFGNTHTWPLSQAHLQCCRPHLVLAQGYCFSQSLKNFQP